MYPIIPLSSIYLSSSANVLDSIKAVECFSKEEIRGSPQGTFNMIYLSNYYICVYLSIFL